MKIAVIHLGFFYAGGGERLVLEQVQGLRKLDHEVELFAPIVDREACYPELIDQVGVHSLVPRPPKWLPGRVALAVFVSCLLAPLIALRFRRFDVILAANQPSLWIALCAARVLGKSYVAYLAQPNRVLYPRAIDLSVPHPNLDYRIFRLIATVLRPIVRRWDHLAVDRASLVLANGSYMAGVLEGIYGRPFESCPAGSHPGLESVITGGRRQGDLVIGDVVVTKPYVLLTNRHFAVKRFDYAIRALVFVPDARLVITGAFTAYTAEVRRLAVDLGVAERVIFTGLVSDSVLAELYSQAAVYVYPAPEEDYGMGIVEAMGHGVPVVAWRSAGPTSSVESGVNGVLVEPFDEEVFGRTINALVCDPLHADKLGRAAWLRVNDGLGYASHCQHLASTLSEAAGHPKRRRLVVRDEDLDTSAPACREEVSRATPQ
jgi:glycosyltransferase involved in cell wall biosynthesis